MENGAGAGGYELFRTMITLCMIINYHDVYHGSEDAKSIKP